MEYRLREWMGCGIDRPVIRILYGAGYYLKG
jgi:hypothetical protein